MSAEEQSLLPRSKNAPEISGSRPQSINLNGSISNDEVAQFNICNPQQPSRSLRAILSTGLLLIGLVVLLFWRPFLSARPEPRTLEERVNRILSDTPLIGKHLSSMPYLDFF